MKDVKKVKKFKVIDDRTPSVEAEKALKAGNDLMVVKTLSEFFDAEAAQRAILLMKKYPARKVFVTTPVSFSLIQKIREKADSGASLPDTYAYAEMLAYAQ